MATPPDFTAGQVLTAAQMNAVGLWLVKKQTIGSAVTSITVNDAFSADYDKYFVTITGSSQSAAGGISVTLGATTSGYYWAANFSSYASPAGSFLTSAGAAASIEDACFGGPNGVQLNFTITDPFAAKRTEFLYHLGGAETAGTNIAVAGAGFINDNTSYTSITLTRTSTRTITGGTILVYGYRN